MSSMVANFARPVKPVKGKCLDWSPGQWNGASHASRRSRLKNKFNSDSIDLLGIPEMKNNFCGVGFS